MKLRAENLLCIMLHSVFWLQVSLQIADGDATVKQIPGTSGSDRSSDLLENDVFSVIGGEDAKRQSKLLNLELNLLSQEPALCVAAQESMRDNVTRDHDKINKIHYMAKINMKSEDRTNPACTLEWCTILHEVQTKNKFAVVVTH